ncbi:MAG: hypothetical protein U0Y96_14280 [Candidatus Kapaibacterium sp.]
MVNTSPEWYVVNYIAVQLTTIYSYVFLYGLWFNIAFGRFNRKQLLLPATQGLLQEGGWVRSIRLR